MSEGVLCRLDALADGVRALDVRIDGDLMPVIVVAASGGVCAFRNVCPHTGLPLTYRSSRVISADGTRIRCSNHGAEFAVADGRALCGIASNHRLQPVAVTVVDGDIRLSMP